MPGNDPLPMIVRLACRQTAHRAPETRYDDAMDMLLIEVEGSWIPAIDAAGPGPDTKKNDLEKGEDRKDRWR